MRRQMLSGAWDPAASVALGSVAAAASCGPMDELGAAREWPASTGPDGRSYDLVVQTARGTDGRLLVIDAGAAGRRRSAGAGWRCGSALTEYGAKASGWEKLAVALGGAAGAPVSGGQHLRTGAARGAAHHGRRRAPTCRCPAEARRVGQGSNRRKPPRGKDPARYWVAPTTGLASGRTASTPDGIGLLDGAIGGFLLAGRLDDGRAADYRVVFEESPTGERRARLQLYRVIAVPGQTPITEAAGGYVDKSGHLAGIAVTGEAPNRHPIITEAHH